VLRSAHVLGVTLMLSVLGCHRAVSEGYWCGTSRENDQDRVVLTLDGPASSGAPTKPIGDAELLAISSDANFDRCGDEPRLRRRELSQEQASELAKVLWLRAEELDASDHDCRLALLERAYYLVPGKHGFALLVGEEAFAVGDCEKASMFLRHFVAYADSQRQPEKWARAQELVTQIETLGCGPQP
jgi:hypothetical protein